MNVEEIWGAYRGSLKAFLRSRISNPTDEEDLLQEILIKTHINIGNLKNHESVKSWLYQIANRTTIDFYRKKGLLREIELDINYLWEGESNSDVKIDLSHCINPFLDALPKDPADLLRAVDIDGKPQKALAKELGISYSTLKSRVQKSREQLKALFDKCCFYTLDKQGNLVDFDYKSSPCKTC